MSRPGMPGPSQPVTSPAASPCGACKFLRRKCTKTCIFAPYFPPDQGQRFANVHKIFGASNVAKLLQELPSQNREDAVNSLSYEADARVNDPIYGCVGALFSLQQQVARLQTELAMAQAELARLHSAAAQSGQRNLAPGLMVSYDGTVTSTNAPGSLSGGLTTTIMQPATMMMAGMAQMGTQQHAQPMQSQVSPQLQPQTHMHMSHMQSQMQPLPPAVMQTGPSVHVQSQPQTITVSQAQMQMQPQARQVAEAVNTQPQIQQLHQPSMVAQSQGQLQAQLQPQSSIHLQASTQHLMQVPQSQVQTSSGHLNGHSTGQQLVQGGSSGMDSTILQDIQESMQQSSGQEGEMQALTSAMLQEEK